MTISARYFQGSKDDKKLLLSLFNRAHESPLIFKDKGVPYVKITENLLNTLALLLKDKSLRISPTLRDNVKSLIISDKDEALSRIIELLTINLGQVRVYSTTPIKVYSSNIMSIPKMTKKASTKKVKSTDSKS